MYKIIRLTLTLSVVHSVSGELCCPGTKCLQSNEKKQTSNPKGRARHTFSFCVYTPQGVTGTLFAPKGTKLSPVLFKQLSQNYTHAGLSIWEKNCRGSYSNTEVRPQFLFRTPLMSFPSAPPQRIFTHSTLSA